MSSTSDASSERAFTSASDHSPLFYACSTRNCHSPFILSSQIRASERNFAAFYRAKSKLLMTRPLRLQLPRHPDLCKTEAFINGGEGRLDAPVDSDGDERPLKHGQQTRQDHQEEQHQQQHQEQPPKPYQERQLHAAPQQYQEQQQQQQQQQQEERQQQPVEPVVQNIPLNGPAASGSSPRRQHTAQWIASRLIAVVKQGANTLLRKSPRRAAGLGVTAGKGGNEKPEKSLAGGGDGSSSPVMPKDEAAELHPEDYPLSGSAGVLAEASVRNPRNELTESSLARVSPEEKWGSKEPTAKIQVGGSMTPSSNPGVGEIYGGEEVGQNACLQEAEERSGAELRAFRSQST